MSTFERALPILLLTLMPLCAQACAGPKEAEEAAGEAAVESVGVEAEEFVLGDEAWLRLPNDSALYGYVVSVQSADGTRSHALFRGPSKLADVLTDGTLVFTGDSLPPRVRLIGPGERLEKVRQ